jgi:hypothetical protein
MSTKWNEACAECAHEQGRHIDRADAPPDTEPCELCACPNFVPSGRPATYDTPEET